MSRIELFGHGVQSVFLKWSHFEIVIFCPSLSPGETLFCPSPSFLTWEGMCFRIDPSTVVIVECWYNIICYWYEHMHPPNIDGVIYILAVICWSCPIIYEAASFSSFIEIIIRDYGEAAAAEREEDKNIPHRYEEKLLVSTIFGHKCRTPCSA